MDAVDWRAGASLVRIYAICLHIIGTLKDIGLIAKVLTKCMAKQSGPSCSKLTMSLINTVKTLIIKYSIYANIFAEKMWVVFAFAKATHIFSAKMPVN